MTTKPLLTAGILLATLFVCIDALPSNEIDAASAMATTSVDSLQIEKDLQQLPWSQFRAVVEAIPKLKADVDAYGSLGWEFVRTRYATYGWRKNVDKLDNDQKAQLVALIRAIKNDR